MPSVSRKQQKAIHAAAEGRAQAQEVMAEFPTSVRIGHFDYKVEVWDADKASLAARYGECSHLEKIIRVARHHSPRQTAETLVHEMLHAIWAQWVIEDNDPEERIVNTLSGALCAAWRDNPEAFEWIKEQVTA